MRARYDVAIVGWGPVGQTLAILLGQRGWSVGVFEKQPAAYPLPRAVHFDHEVGRILQAVGVGEEAAARSEAADVYEWRNAAGATLLRFASKALGVSGWPDANMFAQPELEALLDARAKEIAAIEVHRGHEVVGIDTRAADARVRDAGRARAGATAEKNGGAEDVPLAVATADGRRVDVAARFVVGCDGANSFVRPHLGATVTDLGFFFDWLIVDVRPHRPTVWSPLNVQVCDPARPTTLVSGGPGRRRWEFMRLPGEAIEDLNREDTAWRLLARWDVTPENATLERHTVYRFQARWVDRWRAGRLILAGDAAHQMPPFAGQGMCSGMRDAANLAWKLDLVLADKAPMRLLDTYATERVPHVSMVIDFSMQLGKVICIADPAEAAARDAMMTASLEAGQLVAVPPPLGIGPGVVLQGDPHAGQLFIQARVARGDATGRFDDVVGGGGFTLVSASDDPARHLDADAAAFFASLGGVTAHVADSGTASGSGRAGSGGSLHDVDGTYAHWFADHHVNVVLQRPDFYIFGTAARVADTSRLVRHLRDALNAT